MENNAPTQQSNMAIPIAIVIAGALIAASLYFVSSNPQAGIQLPTAGTNAAERVDIAGVQPDDHIVGSPNAPLVIVEFSDPECPFCAQFHTTMQQVMDEFGESGQVAWVYRNFPLSSLHAKAVPESIALECAAEIGGNDGFWAFTNMLYAETPSNDGLDASQLPEFAAAVGLDVAAFNECLTDPVIEERVQADFEEAVASGGQGTPYNVLLYKDQQIPVEGGIPYQDYNGNPGMKSIIEQVLAQ